jgi:hypothetical protein
VSAFSTYVDRTNKFLSSWQASLLNNMGRVVLINYVGCTAGLYYVGNTDSTGGDKSSGQTSTFFPLGRQQRFLSQKMPHCMDKCLRHQGPGQARDQRFWHTQHMSASKPHSLPSLRGLVGLGNLDQRQGRHCQHARG